MIKSIVYNIMSSHKIPATLLTEMKLWKIFRGKIKQKSIKSKKFKSTLRQNKS